MSDIESTVSGGNAASVSDAQPDTTSSFSFADLHSKAMAFGDDTPAAVPAVEEQVSSDPAPVDPAPNVDAASAAQLAQLSDDQLVEVTVDGEQVRMPWREAKNGIQRQAHYTKSMQQLRTEQAAFQTERQSLAQASTERQQLVALLENPQLLQQFVQAQYPSMLQQAQAAAAQQTGIDPDDIATVGQLSQLQAQAQQNIAAMQQQMEQNLQAQLQQVTQTIEDRAETAKLSSSINDTIGGIFTAHPYLKDIIPNAEQVLRYEVLQLKPTTADETLQAFKQVAEGWVENFDRQVASRSKTTVIAKANLTKNNIMPPGGSQVTPQPQSFKKVNKMTGKTEVDWAALRGVSEGYLDTK